jgi:Glycosyltransferase Family 4
MARPALLCLSQSFAPATTPTAIRASALLARLAAEWDVTVLTEEPQPEPAGDGATAGERSAAGDGGLRIVVVPSRRPARLLAALRRLRLSKLIELLVWPDESIFWVLPAIKAGRRLAREPGPRAIVVFMMPYSAGLAGLALRRLTGLPLILNLDDSPTCTDMHPEFPTALHHRLARRLEDRYARSADATVYVSQTNLESVRARQPGEVRERMRLVRYGADVARFRPEPASAERFEIAYVGAMSGWWALIGQDAPAGPLKRAYEAWARLGRHELVALDPSTSSPAVLGGAMLAAIAEHPEWAGWLQLVLYGNPYPEDVVRRALAAAGVQDVVRVLGPAPHEQVPGILARADLLFITLPRRPDGSRGGRISAKTYEYLMTDRPILAAVPRGENWDYLEGKPGVWLMEPDDEPAMKAALCELARAKADGAPRTFDRSALREELSYDTRAREFAAAIRAAVAHRGRAS